MHHHPISPLEGEMPGKAEGGERHIKPSAPCPVVQSEPDKLPLPDAYVLRTDRAAMVDGTLAADEVTTVGFAMGGAGFAATKYPVREGAGGMLAAMADADVILFS
ncbi:hypothetical protein DXT89_18765 [Agrobacterium vitis]|uniref:Uncharacterized protein n=2 Tax=Agrobacterium vitis TaxID=373 RepID=A0A368NJD1_AGRVI|nr:hypothetical protein DXM22_16975 [Agrobacterium vitis]KAA3525366.1 hypothetical protein DXT89_18765 [Agrobacterium vitis]RCU50256.1 hypothetical protein ASB66_023010 [Agrobacterium vitis]